MKTLFLFASLAFSVAAAVPYAYGILKGKTKPNLVSWITWTMLTGVATAAAFSAHEYTSALFSGSVTLQTFGIVMLSLKYGHVKYTRFDVVCQVSALLGIAVWQLFNSPALGILAAIIIDTIGALPTVRHAWQRPHEEAFLSYALAIFSGGFAIAALNSYSWMSMAYMIYSVTVNSVFAYIIYTRTKVLADNREPKLRLMTEASVA